MKCVTWQALGKKTKQVYAKEDNPIGVYEEGYASSLLDLLVLCTPIVNVMSRILPAHQIRARPGAPDMLALLNRHALFQVLYTIIQASQLSLAACRDEHQHMKY